MGIILVKLLKNIQRNNNLITTITMAKNKAIERIKSYLDERAEKDELFSQMYEKEDKNLKGCFDYIVAQAKKRGNAVCMTDEEVFGLAVHYYCEDDLKENPLPKGVKVEVVASKEDDEDEIWTEADEREMIKRKAVEEYVAKCKEEKKKEREMKSAKKVAEVTAGMGSLFDF